MKTCKFISCAVLLTILISCFMIPSSAAAIDWANMRPEEYLCNYESYIELSDTVLDEGQKCMRGYAMSPDGRYAFMGLLNPNSAAALVMLDMTTAQGVGYYVHEQADGGRGYPKGIAVDDRGYVYVGEAYYQNYGEVDYAILSYSTANGLKEEGFYNLLIDGIPGNTSSPKLGVNGVEVEKIDGKYYMYAVVNYDKDYLYRVDVTDIKNPKIDTSFASNGRIELASFNVNEAQYLDVDTDGTIYLAITPKSGNTGLLVISEDGKTVLTELDVKKGYAVRLWEDYLFVTTQSGPTCLNVFDRITLAPIATIACTEGANSYVYVTVIDDVLYLANQGNNTKDSIDYIGLTAASAKAIADQKAAVSSSAETTVPETTTSAPETTKAPDKEVETTAEQVADTTAAPVETTAAPVASDTTKAPEKEKGGCGSVFACGIALVAVLGSAVVISKKH